MKLSFVLVSYCLFLEAGKKISHLVSIIEFQSPHILTISKLAIYQQ